MEELSIFWIMAAFVIFLALRNIVGMIFQKLSSSNVGDYDKELHDVLTKDEFRVKGRFE